MALQIEIKLGRMTKIFVHYGPSWSISRPIAIVVVLRLEPVLHDIAFSVPELHEQ